MTKDELIASLTLENNMLKDELAAMQTLAAVDIRDWRVRALTAVYGLPHQSAWMAYMLYQAKDRGLNKEYLTVAMPSPRGQNAQEDRDMKAVDVVACNLRKRLGERSLITVRGYGYIMHRDTRNRLARIIRQPQEAHTPDRASALSA